MTSEPPPDSSAFDSLGDDDDDLPPALSAGLPPRRASTSAMGAQTAPIPRRSPSLIGPAVRDRDTIQPPGSQGEYVQQMMELGELDDPSGPLPPPAPRAHDEAIDDVRLAAARRNAATAPALPRPAVAIRLPVPRAPSVPPSGPGASSGDAFESLDALDSLDSLDSIDSLSSIDVTTFRARQTPLPVRSPPPSVGSPPSSGSRGPRASGRKTAPVGLRLGGPSTNRGGRAPRPADPAAPFTMGGPESPPKPPELRAGRLIDDETASADDLPPTLSAPRSAISEPPESDPAPSSVAGRADDMETLFEAKNYPSALVLAESVLVSDPGHAGALRCAERCREMLAQKYLGRLGGREQIPRISMSPEEIRWLALDHRAGFLLSFIDGAMSIDEVLDVSSMAALDALRIMFELREQGAIEIVEPNRRPLRR
jgi:hypothetical protein